MITECGADVYRSMCLAFLQSMIEIPSPSGDENTLAAFIESALADMGLTPERIPTGDGRYAVLCESGTLAKGNSLLLAGHIDTVPPVLGWVTNPHRAAFDGDDITRATRIYGLGACDMKAGLAIMLTIVVINASLSPALSPSSTASDVKITAHPGVLYLLFVPDEEALSAGIRAAIARELPGDFCLMPEPHYDAAVIGAPGKLLLRVRAKGKSAHGARPEEGINAVAEMSAFLAGFGSLDLPCCGDMPPQPFVPLSIRGGADHYSLSVPEECMALVSKQLVPGENKEKIVALLQDMRDRLGLTADFLIEVVPPYYAPYQVDATSAMFQRFHEIALGALGREVPAVFGQSVSDANCIVADAEIPVLIFGPQGGNLHQANEWVDVASIGNCLEVYRRYIFCGSSECGNEVGHVRGGWQF